MAKGKSSVEEAKAEHAAEAEAAMKAAENEAATLEDKEERRAAAETKHLANLDDNKVRAKGGFVYVEQFHRPKGFETMEKVRSQAAKVVREGEEAAAKLEGTVLSRLSLVMAAALDIAVNDVPGANKWLPMVSDDGTPRRSYADCVATLKGLLFPGKDGEKDFKARIAGGSKSNSLSTLMQGIPVAAKAGVLLQIGRWRLSQPEFNNRDVWLKVYDFDSNTWRHVPDKSAHKGRTFQALGGPLSGLEPYWTKAGRNQPPIDMIAQTTIIRATAKHINAQYAALLNADTLALNGTLKRDSKEETPAAEGKLKPFADMSGEEKRTILNHATTAMLDVSFRAHCRANKESMEAVKALAYVVDWITDADNKLVAEDKIEELEKQDTEFANMVGKFAA